MNNGESGYKGLIRTGTTTTSGMTFDLCYSANCFKWTPFEGNPVIDTSPRVEVTQKITVTESPG